MDQQRSPSSHLPFHTHTHSYLLFYTYTHTQSKAPTSFLHTHTHARTQVHTHSQASCCTGVLTRTDLLGSTRTKGFKTCPIMWMTWPLVTMVTSLSLAFVAPQVCICTGLVQIRRGDWDVNSKTPSLSHTWQIGSIFRDSQVQRNIP